MGLGLKVGQKFQESLARNLQDTEDDQYLGKKESFSTTTEVFGSQSRSFIKGAHTRIQAPDLGALQVLLTATEGEQNEKKDVCISAEIGRCFSLAPAVRDCACCNLL